jgi:cellulose synthase/poly-beta-1,6-N-acetylglucosamine synthase-like glycosyltransferase
MTTLLVVLAVAIGLPGLAVAAQYGLLAVASLFYRESRPGAHGGIRFLVLIPAHNEERVIGRCLGAIAADRRNGDIVMVVADRCTDATAKIARRFGASVLERGPDEEPGRAAARQAGLEHARTLDWDAVVMLDADSVISPGFLVACERALLAGADAVQARSESEQGRTLATEASLAAFTLQGVTLPRGRDRLGTFVRLRGTGMAIRRDVALAHRFRAPASEDLFFTLDLLMSGIRCRHVDAARLRSEGASTWNDFGGQKVRYEAGRMAAARAYLPRLVRRALRHGDLACADAAWFLATPPFALAVLSLLAGLALASVAHAWVPAALFGGGLVALAAVVATALVQAGAGARTWLALLAAPWYLAWKAVVQLRAVASVFRRDDYYPPTARV